MLKNLFTFLLLALFAIQVSTFAQDAKVNAKKAPVILNEEVRKAAPANSYIPKPAVANMARVLSKKAPVLMNENGRQAIPRESYSPMPKILTAANWVAVDTMQNSYGPAISILNPVAYDPGSGAVALVHRGRTTYAAGSGTIWYNMSTDQGASWSRVGQVNVGVTIAGRYPSMTISNPTNGGLPVTTGVFSWPELVGGAFGGLGYAADQPLGANAPAAFINPGGTPAFSSQVLTWASDNTANVYWGSDNGTDAAYHLFQTQDFATVDTFNFPSTAFEDGGNICLGGASGGGNTYVGFVGTLPDPAGSTGITSGWYPGVSKKNATGAGWSDIEAVDFRQIPALSRFDRIFDFKKGDEFVSYDGDINVDNQGYPHILIAVTDTTTDGNTGSNAIVEIYKTASGWNGKVVFEGISEYCFGMYGLATPGIGQTGTGPMLAKSADGNAWVAVWSNANGTTPTDTISDIFMSVRSANGDWGVPTNLTQTPLMNEDGHHLAPYVAGSNGSYKTFVWMHYEAGNAGHPIVDTNPSVIYMAAVPFTTQSSAATWVAVDTMQNSYGPAISILNPVAYDPGSDAVALVHRGRTTYAAGSGTIWYNMSTDQGASWSRVGQVNVGVTIAGRYPSMTISNPTNGGLPVTTGVFSWPELVGGAFGGLGYAADQPLGANAPAAFINPGGTPAFSSQVLTWASDNTANVYWGSDNGTDAAYHLFQTQDFATVDTFNFPSTAFEDGGNICLGGASGGGNTYVGFVGTLPDPAGSTGITSGWYPGVSKKNATGAGWSDIEAVDFRQIPALSRFDRIFDFKKGDEFVSYDGDINVDNQGYPHILIAVTDTTTDGNTGSNAIVEIYKTASGWNGKVVFEGISEYCFGMYGLATPGIGQTGTGPMLAKSADGNAWVAVWSNANGTTPTDTISDIFMSVRSANGDWGVPTNLTQTPLMNEDGHHLAPYVAGSNGSYKAFVWQHYEAGNSGHPIVDTNPSVIYMAAVPFTVQAVDVEENFNGPVAFTLKQNYPNPFNPSTSIQFNLSGRANVSLKVFDMLGREVATLVNGVMEAGEHRANFDASKLTSGLYIYKLEAGSQAATRKMMLVK